ncbi:MAG: hypothetical protein HY865_20840 [Chloroflexi bacterium]|nr:hypothetical protein [Chloroflexota bacterium]
MPEKLESGHFLFHFVFLEEEYGFKIQQTMDVSGCVYTALTSNCVIKIVVPDGPNSYPIGTIQPVGTALQEIIEKGCGQRSMYISHIAHCFDATLESPSHWESFIQKRPLPILAEYIKKYCRKMLQGDFSQWVFLEQRIQELLGEYKNCGYKIVELNGKLGLTYNRTPMLEPIYSSVEITNDYSHEYTLDDYKDDPSIIGVGEYNFPIAIADGKYGLLMQSEVWLGFDYRRIIKLTLCHYLCQREDGVFVLYDMVDRLKPLAIFTLSGELCLEKILQILKADFPAAYAELDKRLHFRDGRYISEYRRYSGTEYFSHIHDFDIATVEVVIRDDFSVSPC